MNHEFGYRTQLYNNVTVCERNHIKYSNTGFTTVFCCGVNMAKENFKNHLLGWPEALLDVDLNLHELHVIGQQVYQCLDS